MTTSSSANNSPPPVFQRGGHIHTLDGLRGIAVLMVLVVHLYPVWLIADVYPTLIPYLARIVNPGRYGVELFFVISGFLITGILLDTKGQPGFIGKFYARRTLRIFPLYYGILIFALFVLPWFVEFDTGANTIAAHQLRLWTYTANWPTVQVWDDSSLFLLGHFWSLCVEEHFYLFWPAVVALLSKRNILKITFALVGLGLTCRGVATALEENTPLIFRWLTLERVDGLAIGSMLAIALREPSLCKTLLTDTRYRRLLAISAIACFCCIFAPRQMNHPILGVLGETLVVLFFAVALLGVLRLKPSCFLHRMLISAPLVTFGKYSYGLYVIHGFLRPVFFKIFDFGNFTTSHGLSLLYVLLYYALATGASLALAYLSYNLFEKWFLNLKRYFEYVPQKNP